MIVRVLHFWNMILATVSDTSVRYQAIFVKRRRRELSGGKVIQDSSLQKVVCSQINSPNSNWITEDPLFHLASCQQLWIVASSALSKQENFILFSFLVKHVSLGFFEKEKPDLRYQLVSNEKGYFSCCCGIFQHQSLSKPICLEKNFSV